MDTSVEFTVEAGRPDSITEDKLLALRECGVDRISVNPQTMQQKTLDLIGKGIRSIRRYRHLSWQESLDLPILIWT